MTNCNRRLMAEWEECEYVLLTLPDNMTDWAYMLDEVVACYRDICLKMIQAGERVVILCRSESEAQKALGIVASESMHYVQAEYNDTWMRDYGPLTIDTPEGRKTLDFGFNGWGLKFAADKDNRVFNNLFCEDKLLRNNVYERNLEYILEGGSVESDGQGTILTTSSCLCSINRNGGLTKAEVEKELSDRLGAKRVLWLDHGYLEGDDTDSHIDTLARICPDNTIAYVKCEDENDVHYSELRLMEQQLEAFVASDGKPYRLVALPFARPEYDEEGCRLPATYANYLVTLRNLFMPVYGCKQKDEQAVAAIAKAFPNHKIITADCRALIRQHGSLHCATMQMPAGVIKHNLTR